MANDWDVQVDTAKLQRFAKNLAQGLERGGKDAARSEADRVAGTIRNGVPVLTGRLRASVVTTIEDNGAGVSYGEGVPYAGKIERRDHTCRSAVEGADTMFQQSCEQLARSEVSRA